MSRLTELCDEILVSIPINIESKSLLLFVGKAQVLARAAKVMESWLKEIESEPTYSGYDAAESALAEVEKILSER